MIAAGAGSGVKEPAASQADYGLEGCLSVRF